MDRLPNEDRPATRSAATHVKTHAHRGSARATSSRPCCHAKRNTALGVRPSPRPRIGHDRT